MEIISQGLDGIWNLVLRNEKVQRPLLLGNITVGRETRLLEQYDTIVVLRCRMAEEQAVHGNGMAQDFVVLGSAGVYIVKGMGFMKQFRINAVPGAVQGGARN